MLAKQGYDPSEHHREAILMCELSFSVAFLQSKIATSGDGEIRTLDPLLARQVLSQLSYTPTMGLRRLELPTSRLSGVRSNRLSYKPINLAATYFPMPSPA